MSTSLSTFKFDQRLTDTIEQLKDSQHAASKSEIVRRAIALLKLVQDAKENGERLVLVTDDGKKEREIVLP
ncbi:ribbon-helix-helix protein, CopG family [Xanthomonas campestris pv. raphani]|uniref:ribbon-helix-helix protein, CopG family n=1 Tax=Xanthomonas TaxID=338 RepID=UPI000CEE754A|nr:MULTISPECIES: ribbon-helix-helix protein, CopG family [Xanthomonas]MCE4347990.1 ribbon-helix-helix protein, CopG family [Xanthomonas hortorum pv. cynarae]MEA9825730.1 ribbon-helix-helix protein, CopG family [Xanthomonas campestris pv. raphani]MEA9854000.1 ribbon-helix-helix protein, CopG family [Xanthomonas campestris pv. raphani]MEA9858204.1 ribbon-helix-helix protein, CopG family [Xanthomonas campestris pv. raphani]MEA9967189.1 ribbon-helix-helix protein, CopG family [Xanthomonas campestr